MRILFVGTPGCGKSVLSSQVFAALKQSGRKAELVQEWIRSDIAKNGPMTSIWEQYRTGQYQRELEDAVPAEIDYVVCDSGTLSPYFYATLYADPSDPRQRLVLQDMHKYLIDDLYLKRYDLIFYLPRLMPTDLGDGTRYQTEREIAILDQHMELLFTKLHRLPQVHRVNGALNDRLEEVMWKILGVGERELSPEVLRSEVHNASEYNWKSSADYAT
jgi:hypothetical protein